VFLKIFPQYLPEGQVKITDDTFIPLEERIVSISEAHQRFFEDRAAVFILQTIFRVFQDISFYLFLKSNLGGW
tara:strand:- start:255 stop:473 length:219 start_codon:yes stop_codon:yes gene_type:complete